MDHKMFLKKFLSTSETGGVKLSEMLFNDLIVGQSSRKFWK